MRHEGIEDPVVRSSLVRIEDQISKRLTNMSVQKFSNHEEYLEYFGHIQGMRESLEIIKDVIENTQGVTHYG